LDHTINWHFTFTFTNLFSNNVLNDNIYIYIFVIIIGLGNLNDKKKYINKVFIEIEKQEEIVNTGDYERDVNDKMIL
jgi:hypothetical protein